MNRRSFFKALGGAVTVGAVAPLLPIPAPPLTVSDPATGIAMRFVQQWAPVGDQRGFWVACRDADVARVVTWPASPACRMRYP